MLTAINNVIVINKKTSKIYEFYALQVIFFSLKFVRIVFISSLYNSITLSQIIPKSSIIFAKYFPFSELHVAAFQTFLST